MRKRRRRPKLNTAATEGGQFFPGIQKKLAVGQPGDTFEVEADKMADTVVNGTESTTVQKKDAEEDVQQKPLAETISSVQKKDMQKEENPIQKMEEEEETIQQKSSNSPSHASRGSEAMLKQQKGKGSKMDAATKKQMEQGFGADFNNVTIHTDSSAVELSKNLGAQAFTHGNDIYFNQGKYDPNSKQGKHLLVHELTHTIQQNNSDKKLQKYPNPSGNTTKIGFDRLKELKSIHETTPLTQAQQTEFITVLNPLLNGIALPQIGTPNVIHAPADDKFQPKQIYFETSTRFHKGEPAVTKSGVYKDGEILFNKGDSNVQSEACIIIGPSIIMDTLSHTLSLFEHEGVHIYQNYQNIPGSDADAEVMGYTRQFKRIFDFSEAEIKSTLYQWVTEYVDADADNQSHSQFLIDTYLPQTVTNEGADKVLKVIPTVLLDKDLNRISPKKEAQIKVVFTWLTGVLNGLKI